MTDSNGRPDGSPDLAPDPSYEVPVVTAALSRRALRERLEASSVPPVVESRRERRERELAEATAAASVLSERPSSAFRPARPAGVSAPVPVTVPVSSSVPVTVPVLSPVPAPARRARRDIQGLEHLLLAPVDKPVRKRPQAVEVEVEVEVDHPVPVAEAQAVSETAAEPQVAAAAEPQVAAEAEQPAAAPVHFDTDDLPVAGATSVRTMTFSHDDETASPVRVSAPRGARTSVSAGSGEARGRVVPRLRRTGGSTSQGNPGARKRTIASSVVMVATAGLVATLALPAYAYDANTAMNPKLSASSELGIQSLTVQGVNAQSSTRDDYSTTGNVAAMDSTTGTTVSPTVQALAAELMADVASGKLVGSVPDHIVEIRNLANGIAVPGCGVDYRVLQTIKVAVDNFDKVGVSDINRACTGQIEGAGTASSHYKDGGGHAVDFYILNGHGLTGADSDSLKLIRLLDPLVPKGSGLGQSECRASIAVTNFAPFPDTCTHMHVDFGAAQGVSLKS